MTTYSHRVVVVYSDKDGFFGASGYYGSKLEAQGAMLDIARTWVGMGVIDVRADGSFAVLRDGQPTVTYSVLSERAFLSKPVSELVWHRTRDALSRPMTWHSADGPTGTYDIRVRGNDGYQLVLFRNDGPSDFIGAYKTLKEAKKEAGYHARKAVTAA